MGDNLEVALYGQLFEAAIADRVAAGRRRAGDRGRPPLRERRRADRRDRAARPTGRGPAGGAGHGRLLLHDGQQLQRTRRLPVVFASEGAARLVVRRETLADLLARDVG
jgi:diaminopimelate decarboxylase